MAEEESYGIMPYSEISDLKNQVRKLENKDKIDPNQLLSSVSTLTKGMDSMLQLFKTAAEEMKLEDEEEKTFTKEIKPLMEKLDEIIEQNKIIAEGMVALSDLMKEKFDNLPELIGQQEEKALVSKPIEEPVFPIPDEMKMQSMPQQQMQRMPSPPTPYGPAPLNAIYPRQTSQFPPAAQGMEFPPLPSSFPEKKKGFFKK